MASEEQPKAEETPVVSKTIELKRDQDGNFIEPPSVPAPNRKEVQDKEAKIKAELKEIDFKIDEVTRKAKAEQASMSGQNDGLAGLKNEVKRLRSERDTLIKQRSELYAARDAQKESRDKQMTEMAKLKSQTKYRSVEEIDRVVSQLEHQQSTTSMPLAKEKELLKEIDELKKARKLLLQHQSVNAQLDGSKSSGETLQQQISTLNGQLSTIKKEIDEHQAKINKINEKRNNANFQKLMAQKDELRKQKKAKQEEIQKLWDEFKKQRVVYNAHREEIKAFRSAVNKKRAEEREAAHAEMLKKRQEELLSKTPYEEEMEICDYLVNYLQTNFLASAQEEESKAEAADVNYEGLGQPVATSKKGKLDVYMALGGSKKKGKKGKGAGSKNAKKGKIVLFPETIEWFSVIKMQPPTSLDQVEASIAALKEKKTWFSTLPRGEIPSIAEMQQKFDLQQMEGGRRGDRREKSGPKKSKPQGGKIPNSEDLEAFPTLAATSE